MTEKAAKKFGVKTYESPFSPLIRFEVPLVHKAPTRWSVITEALNMWSKLPKTPSPY